MVQKSNNEKIDIHNYRKRFEWIVKKIEANKGLSTSNRKMLSEYKQSLVVEGLSYPRMLKLLDSMQRIALWLGRDFEKATKKDIDKLAEGIQSNDRISAWTKQGYMVCIKRFFKWLHKSGEYPEIVKHIKTTVAKSREKIPEELLTEEEVMRIINAAENHRDKALISLLYETGARVGELGSALIKHVQIDGSEGYITLHGKTGARKIFIRPSIPYLKKWLEIHPFRNNKDGALFIGLGTIGRNKPITYDAIRKQVADLMKKAGIDKPKNPHNFRHSRATFLAGYLTEAQLNYVMGWKQGSEMASVYVHLNGKDVSDSIRKIYGMGKTQKEQESILKPKECAICSELNEPGIEICNRCGNPLTLEAAIKRHQPDEEKKIEEVLEKLLWEKYKNQFLPLIKPEQAKELLEEAKEISKNQQVKAISVS